MEGEDGEKECVRSPVRDVEVERCLPWVARLVYVECIYGGAS